MYFDEFTIISYIAADDHRLAIRKYLVIVGRDKLDDRQSPVFCADTFFGTSCHYKTQEASYIDLSQHK